MVGAQNDNGSRIYYITGLSVGVGKGTIAYAMAETTAKVVDYLRAKGDYSGRQTVYLLELDWEKSRLSEGLSSENTIQHMAEAIGDLGSDSGTIDDTFIEDHLDESTVVTREGLHVIPAPFRAGWAAESPEKFRNLMKAYESTVQYLINKEHGSIIFVSAPVVAPPSKEPVAKNLLSNYDPHVTVVSTVNQVGLTHRAADILTMPIDGKKTSSSQERTVTRSGYGVDESRISVVLNKVPNTPEAKKKLDKYLEESYFGVSGVIPYLDQVAVGYTFIGSCPDKQQFQRDVVEYLSKIGFPEFTALLTPGDTYDKKRRSPVVDIAQGLLSKLPDASTLVPAAIFTVIGVAGALKIRKNSKG